MKNEDKTNRFFEIEEKYKKEEQEKKKGKMLVDGRSVFEILRLKQTKKDRNKKNR